MKTIIHNAFLLVCLMAALGAPGCGDEVTNNQIESYSVPGAPQNVQAVAADSQAAITWGPVAGATSYNIYWKTSSGVTTTDNVIVSASSPYAHSGLTNGTAYYYSVAAVNIEGEGPLSAEVSALPVSASTVPAAPSGIQLTPANGQITISWGPVSGASYYNIYWATAPGVDATSNMISTSQFPYAHTGLSTATTYYYRVSAVGSTGEGQLSVEVSARAKTPFNEMLKQVLAGDAQAVDYFGNSVSISGDYAIVGATGEDGGIGDPHSDAGAAYIFHRTGANSWDSGTKIMAADSQTSDYFGNSVSISGDYAIVGAHSEDGVGDPLSNAGAAYIFHRTGPNSWDGGTKIMAPDSQAGDYFGNSVSISGDYAIVGAYAEDGGIGDPLSDAGAAYIFHRTGANSWDSGTKIMAADSQASDYFAKSVSISGDYAVVGAYSEDGGTGDPLVDAGAAYIFHRTGTNTWDSGTKIVAPDAQASDSFGWSVSISGDYAIAGAYREDGGIGDPLSDAGAAYIFHRTGANSWDSGTKIAAADAQAVDNFGISVSISGDYAIAGAHREDGGIGDPFSNAGAAYIFHRTGANSWDGGTKIMAADSQASDYFGTSVSISGDYAIVGANGEDGGIGDPLSDAGAAYIY